MISKTILEKILNNVSSDGVIDGDYIHYSSSMTDGDNIAEHTETVCSSFIAQELIKHSFIKNKTEINVSFSMDKKGKQKWCGSFFPHYTFGNSMIEVVVKCIEKMSEAKQ